MKKIIKWVVLVAAVVAIPSFFIHPFGRVKAANSPKPLFSGAQIEPPIFSIVQRSCASCHSEQTAWPWYSYLPPASWMVEKDVHDGRDHFNMSHWEEYSAEQRIEILSKISVMVRNKQMPLPRYTWLHSEAKLSDADVSLMDRWSHAERKRLRAEAAPQGNN
jgi:Haem-binding domain